MTSLTKRLMGKTIMQVMEYEEELVHNILAATRNAIISVAKKVEDNVLHVITTPVVAPQSASPQNPAGQPAMCLA